MNLTNQIKWLSIALMLWGVSATAETQRFKWRLPIYMGFSFNDHESTNVAPIRGYTGINFGLGVTYKFLPMFSLGADMLFIHKSYELEDSGTIYRYDPGYLEFPVQLYFQPASWIYFHAGPYLASIILSGTKQGQGQLDAIKLSFANDYGLTMGFWIGIASNPKLHVGIDFRYDYGLADIQFTKWPNYTIHSRSIMPLFTVTWLW